MAGKIKIFFIVLFGLLFVFLVHKPEIIMALEALILKCRTTLTETSSLPILPFIVFSRNVARLPYCSISLVWAGVLYFLSPLSAEIRADAKDRVAGAISGLLI